MGKKSKKGQSRAGGKTRPKKGGAQRRTRGLSESSSYASNDNQSVDSSDLMPSLSGAGSKSADEADNKLPTILSPTIVTTKKVSAVEGQGSGQDSAEQSGAGIVGSPVKGEIDEDAAGASTDEKKVDSSTDTKPFETVTVAALSTSVEDQVDAAIKQLEAKTPALKDESSEGLAVPDLVKPEPSPLAAAAATIETPQPASVSKFKAQFDKPDNVALIPDKSLLPESSAGATKPSVVSTVAAEEQPKLEMEVPGPSPSEDEEGDKPSTTVMADGRAVIETPGKASVSAFTAQFDKPDNVALMPDKSLSPKKLALKEPAATSREIEAPALDQPAEKDAKQKDCECTIL